MRFVDCGDRVGCVDCLGPEKRIRDARCQISILTYFIQHPPISISSTCIKRKRFSFVREPTIGNVFGRNTLALNARTAYVSFAFSASLVNSSAQCRSLN